MDKPILKQFGELRSEDFEQNPVWINCHVADYDEPWYDETDEETFRPWTDDLPVDPSLGMLLVRCSVVFNDGSEYTGFLTPASDQGDLGIMQPQIFIEGDLFGFWGGMFGFPLEARRRFYGAVGKTPDQIFPIRFSASSDLTSGVADAEVQGFYKSPSKKKIEIER